jgi:hypothetical protein
MERYESSTRQVNKPASYIYNFISDFNNFGKLLPEQVSNWKCTENECSFVISGLPEVSLKISEKIPNQLLKVTSASTKVPFPFSLNVHIKELSDGQCETQVAFEGELNMMFRMMVEKPMRNFVNMINDKLKETAESN